jgi:hypothetical protein
MIFERDIMYALRQWVDSDVALLLKGVRQSGKTFSLRQLGIECFKNVLFVNFRSSDVVEWFDAKTKEAGINLVWADIFAEFATWRKQSFTNDKDTLVILDEIQLSRKVFNGMREMVRENHFRIAATGSYLGILALKNRYGEIEDSYQYAAGDVLILDMYPLTYKEVIAATEKYQGERTLKEIYQYYLRFGGFPDVVTKWLSPGSTVNDYYRVLGHIYSVLVDESQQYFEGGFPESVWTDTLISVIKGIRNKFYVPSSPDVVLQFRTLPGLNINKPVTVEALRWLTLCNLAVPGYLTNNLRTLDTVRYVHFLADNGLMLHIVNIALTRGIPGIERDAIMGLLAENFVALCLNEFTGPRTYYSKPDEIDFVFKQSADTVAIEVKYTKGATKASTKLLNAGKVRKLIKIVGDPAANAEESGTKTNVEVLPIWETHKLATMFGCDENTTKYNRPFFDANYMQAFN